MPQNWKEVGPVTLVLLLLVVIVALAGGVIVVVQPKTLTFPQYLDKMKEFAVALGLLGIGRGLPAAAKLVQLPVAKTRAAPKTKAKPGARGSR